MYHQSNINKTDKNYTRTLFKHLAELASNYWSETKKLILIGENPVFIDAINQLEIAAQQTCPILLIGETGTGKELFARALYLLGARCGKPYITVNCAQFSNSQLLISELFGHEKGSFTGATTRRPGIFRAANGGVVFLDEIGELRIDVQALLLRVLETGEIKSLGSDKEDSVDLRFITATNQPLEIRLAKNLFRSDLYFRLAAFPIRIPPLRERGTDINLLLDYYLQQLNHSCGLQKKFTPAALRWLQEYSWPGNVRQLIHLVNTAYQLSSDKIIQLETIQKHLTADINIFGNTEIKQKVKIESNILHLSQGEGNSMSLKAKVGIFERQEIIKILEKNHWNIARTAAFLGLTWKGLKQKIKRYSILKKNKF